MRACLRLARTGHLAGNRLPRFILLGRPSPGRGLEGPSDLSRASLGRGDSLAAPLPNAVWERSSRAFSDARVRACLRLARTGQLAGKHLPRFNLLGRPSPGRGLEGPSDRSRASLGRGGLLRTTSPKLQFGRGGLVYRNRFSSRKTYTLKNASYWKTFASMDFPSLRIPSCEWTVESIE